MEIARARGWKKNTKKWKFSALVPVRCWQSFPVFCGGVGMGGVDESALFGWASLNKSERSSPPSPPAALASEAPFGLPFFVLLVEAPPRRPRPDLLKGRKKFLSKFGTGKVEEYPGQISIYFRPKKCQRGSFCSKCLLLLFAKNCIIKLVFMGWENA
jgi:hypothetical protein